MDVNEKTFVSIVIGFLISIWNQYGFLSALVCGAIIFDIITGILKAKIQHTINSNT